MVLPSSWEGAGRKREIDQIDATTATPLFSSTTYVPLGDTSLDDVGDRVMPPVIEHARQRLRDLQHDEPLAGVEEVVDAHRVGLPIERARYGRPSTASPDIP
jgi:hypothetical protein